MAMSIIWVIMVTASIIYGFVTGRVEAVSAAAAEGAAAAVTLCLGMAGVICLWSGVVEVMSRSGIMGGLSRLLRPLLKKLFPSAMSDGRTADAITANVSANMLGLGNAATPMGIRACTGMLERSGGKVATDEICRFVVMNTASIQLLPTTVAGVRAAAGASAAFDILPAVWITSIASVSAGLICSRLLSRFTR